MSNTLRRLQVIMLVLWVCLLGFEIARSEWRAASVLTLTVAAAIVQLRWLASQVSSLVSLARASAEFTTPAAVTRASETSPEGKESPVNGTVLPLGTSAPNGLESPVETWTASSRSVSDQDQELASEVRKPSAPKLFALVVLRPSVLLLGGLVLFTLGGSEPLALAAGILTFPAALMIEALWSALRPARS